jgi:hypothetical protein
MQKVRSRAGTPVASDFSSADGSPLVQNSATGQWFGYANGMVYPLGPVNVKAFATVQAALDSGLDLVFPEGDYPANNLTQSTNGQRLYADGEVTITKNANGDLFTSSGSNVQIHGIGFRGDASSPVYTGHNVVSSGDHFSLINCGSRWAYARAV